VTAIKLPFIACDFLCAWYIYRIVLIKYNSGPTAIYAALAALLAPTMVLNSSTWGQVDILYTTCLVACLYYVLMKKNFLACLAFGIAISSKPQAIFLAPFIVLLFLRQHISFKNLLVVPLIYLASLLPAWAAGRPLLSLLTIYTSQANLYQSLTVNAPNMYTWFPDSLFNQLYLASLIFGVSIVLLYIAIAYQSKVPFTMPVMVYLAMLSVLLCPFFLPKMHERYFFASDVISIVFAFYFPKKAYLSVALNVLSFFSYQFYLFRVETVSQGTMALFRLVIIVILVWQLALLLYPKLIRGSDEIPI
jgi:Gpi18-like mannosyltransferase